MRVFQFISAYLPYCAYLERKFPEKKRALYRQKLGIFLNHRYYASHILKPVHEGSPEMAFTVANDLDLQLQWARENSLRTKDKFEILRAQIENHKTEVLYSLDPITFDSKFVRSLPGCVKKTIAWNAAPKGNADLSAYDLVVSNFPYIREWWKSQGLRVAHFFPGHDEVMDTYASRSERPIDICFAGQYSSWWKDRNSVLSEIAKLSDKYLVSFRLLAPKWKTLGAARGLNRIKLPLHYLPPEIRAVAADAVYGLELYELFGSSKIVFNASIDSVSVGASGKHRGNMRCFEALGLGACMVSDAGNYADGFQDGVHFASYPSGKEIVPILESLLRDPDQIQRLAQCGSEFVREKFSKANQWTAFEGLVAAL